MAAKEQPPLQPTVQVLLTLDRAAHAGLHGDHHVAGQFECTHEHADSGCTMALHAHAVA